MSRRVGCQILCVLLLALLDRTPVSAKMKRPRGGRRHLLHVRISPFDRELMRRVFDATHPPACPALPAAIITAR